MPEYVAQVLSLRRPEKDLLLLASHQPGKVVGGQGGFLDFLGNLGNTFFSQSAHTQWKLHGLPGKRVEWT